VLDQTASFPAQNVYRIVSYRRPMTLVVVTSCTCATCRHAVSSNARHWLVPI